MIKKYIFTWQNLKIHGIYRGKLGNIRGTIGGGYDIQLNLLGHPASLGPGAAVLPSGQHPNTVSPQFLIGCSGRWSCNQNHVIHAHFKVKDNFIHFIYMWKHFDW